MSEFSLQPRTALAAPEPLALHWPEFSVHEVRGLSLTSIAPHRGCGAALATALQEEPGLGIPNPGKSETAAAVRCYWMGPEQYFLERQSGTGAACASELAARLQGVAAVTDQSDAWLTLELVGRQSRAVLEKLCTIDLHPGVFTVGSVARTQMEHHGVVIALLDPTPRFRLLTARSSARTFEHALRTAALSACGPM